MKRVILHLVVLVLFVTVPIGHAEESPSAPAAEPEAAPAPTFLVLVPEKIDVEWFWYHYTAESQHLVQSAIEKALVRDDHEVVDVTAAASFQGEGRIDRLTAKKEALRLAEELGASHVIVGSATAILGSHGTAYGVNVYRSTADATVKIIAVSDGKVLAVIDAEATEGAQSQRDAARQALKAAGKKLAREVAGRIGRLL